VLEVLDPGCTEPVAMAPGADLRTDVARYRVYRDGSLVAEPDEILQYWRPDLVSFLLGCSFTFESALLDAGIPVRQVGAGLKPRATADLKVRPTSRLPPALA